ncbi:hypothetical protein J6590_052706 [Homalodisca vitripennis]|nr:hypothetical protein J6590_052706 [Homalodisca vitripennis]
MDKNADVTATLRCSHNLQESNANSWHNQCKWLGTFSEHPHRGHYKCKGRLLLASDTTIHHYSYLVIAVYVTVCHIMGNVRENKNTQTVQRVLSSVDKTITEYTALSV